MNTANINMIFLAGSLIVSGLMGALIVPRILLISYKRNLFDLPDGRKVHTTPVPRLGGLSFFPVILITVFLCISLRGLVSGADGVMCTSAEVSELLFIFAGLTMLYLVGESDDLIGVGYRVKFAIQALSSCLLLLSGNWFDSLGGLLGLYSIPAWAGMPLTVLVIVLVTNAINLIDGIDGLASGLCCISLAVLSWMFISGREYVYAVLSLSTLGVTVPFWFYNVFGNERRGHKLFMGDTGSLTLGYILGFLILKASCVETGYGRTGNMVIAFSTLIVPLFDVARVVFHRLRKGRNPFLPDRNHFHHKLLRTGMRMRHVLVFIMATVVTFIVLNAVLVPYLNVTVLLSIDIVLWTLMQLAINRRIRIYAQTHPDARMSYVKE